MKSFLYKIVFTRADGTQSYYIAGGPNEDEAVADFYFSTASKNCQEIIKVQQIYA